MTLFQPQSTTKGKMLPYFYCVPYTSIFFIVVLPFGRFSCRSSVNNMETDRHTDDPETQIPHILTISVSSSAISSLGTNPCSGCSSSFSSVKWAFLKNSSMSSGQSRLSSGSHVFSALRLELTGGGKGNFYYGG